MSGTKTDNLHSCRPASLHPGVGVFKNYAPGRLRPQQLGRFQIDIRMRLGTWNLVTIHNYLKIRPQSGLVEDETHIRRFRVAGDRLGSPGESPQEVSQPRHQHLFQMSRNHAAVQFFFGCATSENFGGLKIGTEKIADDFVVAFAVHAAVHLLGRLDAESTIEGGPGFPVERIGIDDDAVHIENEGEAQASSFFRFSRSQVR